MTAGNTPFLSKNISENLLPNFYKTVNNKRFLQSTIDQLVQPGTAKKVSGFIGRRDARATQSNDVFIEEPSLIRQNYQLEPGLVIKDTANNVKFFKDYQDYINQLVTLGANAQHHERLNDQELYSWTPYICWDKFVNFQNYYWVPDNSEELILNSIKPIIHSIDFNTQPSYAKSVYELTNQATNIKNNYIFGKSSSLGQYANPTIALFRGHTYVFEVNCPGNPVSIKTSISTDSDYRYLANEISSSVENGVIELTVPPDAPDTLYYQSDIDSTVWGLFTVLDYNGAGIEFDLTRDLIGKRQYLPNTIDRYVSNGMKIYVNGAMYFIEGVGDAINVIPVEKLLLYNTDLDISTNNNAVYAVINRCNSTYNQWSRFNRWFHKDVIEFAATYNNLSVNLSQLYRASRPIIEFDGQLQLFNYGKIFVDDVDVYDAFTNDLLSINGKIGYFIDEINLVDIINSNSSHVARVLSKKTNNIYNIILDNGLLSITSIESPEEQQVVLVKQGTLYGNRVFWCTIDSAQQLYWVAAQYRSQDIANQPPLFDVFGYDSSGQIASFSDVTRFKNTTFSGTKLFSYKISENSIEDTVLNFKLSYKNIENTGDILFDFNFNNDEFEFLNNESIQKQAVNTGFLQKTQVAGDQYVNCWTISRVDKTQPAIRIYKNHDVSVSEEDKSAQFYDQSTIYYPGDIVRETDNNLYQVKLTGGVLPTGISGISPIEDVAQSIWAFYASSSLILNNFDLDIFDNKNDLSDLTLQIYVNAVRLPSYAWHIEDGAVFKKIVLNQPLNYNDILTIKAFTKQPINNNGFYQIPINLQKNPTNQLITALTYSEILDHSQSIIDNFGLYNPETSSSDDISAKMRDLGDISSYGTQLVQHSGPIGLSLYHITSESHNIIRSIEKSTEDYTRFKRAFISIAETLGVDADTVSHVNLILKELNKDAPSTSSYYLSDMLGYQSFRKNEFTVIDNRIKVYPLTLESDSSSFNLTQLSNKAVYVYLNQVQLLHELEYSFSDQGFVEIKVNINIGDIIDIYEYDTTDGSLIPETPTKLGLWPKYQPKRYLDTTLVTPRYMIQGHDGSLTLAYGDYRDDLLLELEKRIFNNIKVQYDPSIFDIQALIPSYINASQYNASEFTQILAVQFYKWLNFTGQDVSKPLNFDQNNQFTFNYKNFSLLDGAPAPGYWRGIYKWMLGTDRPHLCPWEMLGFSEEPTWWAATYGTAPFNNQNILMWKDISQGIIRDPAHPITRLLKYVRPFLLDHLPVDNTGQLIGPLDSGLVNGTAIIAPFSEFVFGDHNPVETAWRRSSYYPFGVLISTLLMHPAAVFGLTFDRSRITRDITNQIVYKNTSLRIDPTKLVLPSTVPETERIQTAGIVNYLMNYIVDNKTKFLDDYQYDIQNLKFQLGYRVGGFTSKSRLQLLLDSRSLLASSTVFVPQENYELVVNQSSPFKKIIYSGVIITKVYDGFEIKGYTRSQPYFNYYQWSRTGTTINVGGISEGYILWQPNEQYVLGKIVEYNNRFYRVKTTHVSKETFELTYYQPLVSLPVVGGKNALIRVAWDTSTVYTLPYGTKLSSIQQVVDFLLGYGAWLTNQGIIFDQLNSNSDQIMNWETSAKEFLFWTTQNWSTGQDRWQDWIAGDRVLYGTIVQFNGEYYRAERNVPDNIEGVPVFPNEYDQYANNIVQYYEKLNGLSTIGSSVIALSPLSSGVTFQYPVSIVKDIRNQFYSYEIFTVDGSPIPVSELTFYKTSDVFNYSTRNGTPIYSATFYLIQEEHVVIIDNNTIFNDLIYNPITGHQQERIKITGYLSTEWDGSLNVPGFILDQAKIKDWAPWVDYVFGDMVKHKEFYYSAKSFVPGSFAFNEELWVQLDEAPTSRLLPNWSYRASQFTDFYSLDSDNFDVTQQKTAQHLIGYQKRQYLSNIIKDDVSEFKFYQGMIIEKGTQNVFNKLFDTLSSDEQDSIDFYEDWALRVGRYGASAAYDSIEFILQEDQFKSNPQGFELTTGRIPDLADFIIRLSPADVYLKPQGYDSTPFPTSKKYKSVFVSAGSVQEGEVQFIYKNISEILNKNTNEFNSGSYIWCTFEGDSWNVYKFVITNHILDIELDEDQLYTVKLMIPSTVESGNYIGLLNLNQGSGFYKVERVLSSTTIKIKTNADIIFDLPFAESNTARFAELVEQRILYFDSLAEQKTAINVYTKQLVKDNLVWADGDVNVPWSTWIYSPVYDKKSIWSYDFPDVLGIGEIVAVNEQGTTLVVATTSGSLLVYFRATPTFKWTLITRIELADSGLLETTDRFNNIAVSDDGIWIAASIPTARGSRLSLVDELYIADLNGSITSTSQGLVFLYEKISTVSYVLKYAIASPSSQISAAGSEQFGHSLAFSRNVLYIGAPGYRTGSSTGRVYSLNYISKSWKYNEIYEGESGFYNFGHSVSVNSDTSLIAISAINGGTVNIYNLGNTNPIVRIRTPDVDKIDLFGTAIALSLFDNYIAISATYAGTSQGVVYVYSFNTTTQTSLQEQLFTRLLNSEAPGFGDKISFIENYSTKTNNNNTLVIYDSYNEFGYDGTLYDSVLYDNELYQYEISEFGLVNIYDRHINKWVLGERVGTVKEAAFNVKYGQGIGFSKNSILVGAPSAEVTGQVYEYKNNTESKDLSWTIKSQEQPKADAYKIKRAFLYNKSQPSLVEYLDVIDCSQGKIPGIADQEIRYKTFYDPATYSNLDDLLTDTVSSVNIGANTVTIDNGRAWGKQQVGALWWDFSTAKFNSVYERDIVYRNGFQNSLVTGASIDIYEWVESKYIPSSWDELADTEEGSSLGISGTSLYGNAAYCVNGTYDTVSQTYSYLYYYWVKNKKTVPDVLNRKLSSYDIAQLISNPRGQNYRYLTITGTNSFSLINVKRLLSANDVVLSIDYWTTDVTDQNIHSEWRLVNNDVTSQLPRNIEQKWFDSLVGRDQRGLPIPNLSLPVKIRYGIENRPRQSMFINRFEALKQVVEHANMVFSKYQIAEQRSLTKLNSYTTAPSVYSGKYDVVVENFDNLAEISVSALKRAAVIPIIVDGRIVDVDIVDPGLGYVGRVPYENEFGDIIGFYGPTVTITGNGKDAVIFSIINDRGSLINTYIKDNTVYHINLVSNSGQGYDSNTRLAIRNYSVLVQQDEASQNSWGIYSYFADNKRWAKTLSQAYDVRKYWERIDWYAEGYDQFTVADYAIDNFGEVPFINAGLGSKVKVRQTANGGWILLKRISLKNTTNWNENYQVIGIQAGTIKLKENLYNFGETIGYSGTFYDSVPYDNIILEEIRYVLEAIRDEILIGDLRSEYLNLFFISLRYALSEQHYLDWAFKTSLIKAKHNVGALSQKTTYKNDNLENFENYIAEVKPYRTKIREYVSCYSQLDKNITSATDFDLPVVLQEQSPVSISTYLDSVPGSLTDKTVRTDRDELMQQYPWKYWFDNCKTELSSVEIIASGQNYELETTSVIVTGACEEPAVLKAVINNGKIVEIVVINPGRGYYFKPIINIVSNTGTGAVALAITGSKIRSSKIAIKFDRTEPYTRFTQLTEIEQFTIDDVIGGLAKFKLNYLPSSVLGELTVFFNDIELLPTEYSIEKIYDTLTKTYKTPSAWLLVKEASTDQIRTLGASDQVRVEYHRNQAILPATSRIMNYYVPSIGELGRDISQLLVGSVFNGSLISGLDLNADYGWNSLPFFSTRWDASLKSNSVVSITVTSVDQHQIQLPYVPELNEVLNVYYSKKYIDAIVSNGTDVVYEFDKNVKFIQVHTEYTTVTDQETSQQSDVVYVNSTINIGIGDIITGAEEIIGTVSSINANQTLTVTNIEALSLDDIIKFTGTVFGGIIVDKSYYITSIDLGSSQITIRTLKNSMESVVSNLTPSSGSMNYVINDFFIYNTSVINKTDTSIQLEYPVAKVVPAGTLIKFKKDLQNNSEITVYSNGVFVLADPVPENNIIHITGYYKEVRLDDLRFGNSWEISSTKSAGNLLITTTPLIIRPGTPVVFSGTTYGNIIESKVYFIHSIESSNVFRVTSEINGTAETLETATGTMTLELLMDSWVGDGISNTILVPSTFPLTVGDQYIVHNTYSDGSIEPYELDYDTALDGGTIDYSTATGVDPTSIIVDCVNSGVAGSPALEEVFPGTTGDAVAIKVYERTPSEDIDFASITVDRYIADGASNSYILSQKPNSPSAVLVKAASIAYMARLSSIDAEIIIGNQITNETSTGLIVEFQKYSISEPSLYANSIIYTLSSGDPFNLGDHLKVNDVVIGTVLETKTITYQQIKTANVDYIYNYDTNQVSFSQTLAKGTAISIFNIGFNNSIIGVDYITANGVFTAYTTAIPYSSLSFYSPVVYVNGVVTTPQLEETAFGSLLLRFATAPAANSLITVVVSKNTGTIITHTEKFTGNSEYDYELLYDAGTYLPYETNILVRADQQLLTAQKTVRFTIGSDPITGAANLYYYFDEDEFAIGSILDLSVIVEGKVLSQELGEYSVNDFTTQTPIIQLSADTYTNYFGKIFTVYPVTQEYDYVYTPRLHGQPPRISLNQVYDENTTLEVVVSYKHELLGIQRNVDHTVPIISLAPNSVEYHQYKSSASGFIRLSRPVLNENYVWVAVNKQLLTPVFDYKLNEDKSSIQLSKLIDSNSMFDIITYEHNMSNNVSYMQFKDILGRIHFKRLNQNKQTKLAKDLRSNDITIEVEQSNLFDTPNRYENKPGVIYINGERIEYFSISGNTLTDIRRGTLGTGVAMVHLKGTAVQEIGPNETIPYTDTVLLDRLLYINEQPISLVNVNTVIDNETRYKNELVGDNSQLKADIAQNSVEVSTGGYIIIHWSPASRYLIGDLAQINGDVFRCTTSHTSSNNFFDDADNWTAFSPSRVLQKNDYQIHYNTLAPDSPDGDVMFNADYSIDLSNNIEFTTLPSKTVITVLQRTGINWDQAIGQSLPIDESTAIGQSIAKIVEFIKAVPGSAFNW